MEKKIRYFTLPNILTLFNLISGSFAIYFAFEAEYEKLYYASYFIFIACVFDVLDGAVARMTNSVSDIGKHLDSYTCYIERTALKPVIQFPVIQLKGRKNKKKVMILCGELLRIFAKNKILLI